MSSSSPATRCATSRRPMSPSSCPSCARRFQGAFDCAVVDDAIEADTREMAGVYKTPSLIFYRDGQQIGALPKVRDWSDYMARIAQILAARTEPEAPTPETEGDRDHAQRFPPSPLSASAPAPSRQPPRGRNSATWPCPRTWPSTCPTRRRSMTPRPSAPALTLLRDVTAACAEAENGGSRQLRPAPARRREPRACRRYAGRG
jgi:hypothetical protein